MNGVIDLKGKKFGHLTVKEYIGTDKHNNAKWLCQCDCGNECEAISPALKQGKKMSCGCVSYKGENNGMYKHGKSNTRIHKIWDGIKYRCNNQNATGYKNYGGRGIGVCHEWESSFESFYKWAMSNGYNDDLSIERIDYNKGYCPENCKWIPLGEQPRNRRNTRTLTYNGITKTFQEWADDIGIKYATLYSRYRKGWSVEQVLFYGETQA